MGGQLCVFMRRALRDAAAQPYQNFLALRRFTTRFTACLRHDINQPHRYFAFFLCYGGYGESFKKFYSWETFGTAFDPPIPATLKPFILVMVSLVALQSVFNLFSDWKLEPVKHSATDDIEDEIETLKRNVGSN